MVKKNYYLDLRKNNPIVNVDALILNKKKQILLLKRNHYPYEGYWVLPGGGVEGREKIERAILREVREETGLPAKIRRIIGIYSGGKRDPRYPSLSIAYYLTTKSSKAEANQEAKELQWFNLNKLPKKIGFDHKKMIHDLRKQLG